MPTPVRLFDVPWEQVLCQHLLPCLTLKELFVLRGMSRECRDLVDCYFSLAFSLNTVPCAATFSSLAFDVVTRSNGCLKEMVLCNSRDWLSDGALVPVLQSNPGLQKLDLSNCLGLSNASLYTVGAHCRGLSRLSLRGCVWVSGAGLVSLLANHLPLAYVDLCGCWDLSDDDIIALAMHCNGIKYLLLNNIYGLTNRSVAVLAHYCPKLVQLSVQGCWRLTDQAIQAVTEYCPDLRALQVRECRQVTELSLAKLRAKKVRIDRAAPPSNSLHGIGMEHRPLNLQI